MSSESSDSHAIYSNNEASPVVTNTGINIAEAIATALDGISSLKPEEIKEWIKNKKELRIIVTGKTGTGKSSLLNSFIGYKLFKEGGDLDPHTKVVDQRVCEMDGIRVIAWDCPGLQDGTDNEDEYLKDLVEKTKRNVDLMLYCADMSVVRADLWVHESAIQKLTEILGLEVWRNTVIALTFANQYETRLRTNNPKITEEALVQKFAERIDVLKTKLQAALPKVGVTDDVVKTLPVFPAGYHTTPHLPGHPLWASRMRVTMLYVVKEHAKPLPIKLNMNRFKDIAELSDEQFNLNLPPEEQYVFVSAPFHDEANIKGVTAAGVGVKVGAVVSSIKFWCCHFRDWYENRGGCRC